MHSESCIPQKSRGLEKAACIKLLRLPPDVVAVKDPDGGVRIKSAHVSPSLLCLATSGDVERASCRLRQIVKTGDDVHLLRTCDDAQQAGVAMTEVSSFRQQARNIQVERQQAAATQKGNGESILDSFDNAEAGCQVLAKSVESDKELVLAQQGRDAREPSQADDKAKALWNHGRQDDQRVFQRIHAEKYEADAQRRYGTEYFCCDSAKLPKLQTGLGSCSPATRIRAAQLAKLDIGKRLQLLADAQSNNSSAQHQAFKGNCVGTAYDDAADSSLDLLEDEDIEVKLADFAIRDDGHTLDLQGKGFIHLSRW